MIEPIATVVAKSNDDIFENDRKPTTRMIAVPAKTMSGADTTAAAASVHEAQI